MVVFSARMAVAWCGMAVALLCPAMGQGYAQRGGYAGGRSTAMARRAAPDPAEIYLTAYRLCRESEKLAGQGNYTAALQKGRQAEKVLAGIVRDFPQWKSSLLSTRRKLLAENMANYRKKAQEAPIPTGRQPGKPVASDVRHLEVPGLPRYSPETSTYRPVELPDYESSDKEMYNALALAQEECRKMAVAYKELDARFKEVQKKLTSAELEQQMYKERYEKLQAQISSERAAGNRVVDSLSRQLSEMEARYRASEQARQEAEARVAELESTLAATQAELERVTRERDALRAENEQLRAIVELNNPEKTTALLDQNLTLAEQLKQAQARVAALEARAAGTEDEQEVLSRQLEEARQEAERLREEMGGIYDENMGYRRRVSELTQQLNNLEADLEAQEGRPQVDPALKEENKLLREVIAKQRRTLMMQEEGRRLLVDTYKQLKHHDPAMLNALQKLEEESSLDLTDAEKRVMETVLGKAREDTPDVSVAADELAAGAKAVREGLEVETLANLAAKAFAKARYTAAEQLYRTLHEAQPDHVAGLVNLGTILLYRNKCEEAAELLGRASRLSPDLAITYYLAGIACYRLDRMPEARQMFARTVELDPANAEAFFYLANIEGIDGQYERALKHYAAAVKLKPSLGDAHYNMARLYAELKKIPDAARAYDRAVHNGAELDPEFEQYLRNHPDVSRQPGVDLVAEVAPEEAAAELLNEDPEMRRLMATDRADNAALAQQEKEQAKPEEQAKPDPEEAAMEAARARIVKEVQAAPTASPAGLGHETDPGRFSTVTVRKRIPGSGRMRVKLRLKRPEPQRIRPRGGEIQMLKRDR